MALLDHTLSLRNSLIGKGKNALSLCLFLLYISSGALLWFLSGERGSRPNKKEKAEYRKLSNYQDGIFVGSEPIKFDAEQVREGSATLSRFFGSSRFAPNHPLPMRMLNKESFSGLPSQSFQMYWLGHASAIIEMGGKRIAIDLVFDNAAPIPMMTPRYDRCPLQREDIPQLDYFIITHNHYDHLEKKTVQNMKNTHFLVPMGLKRTLINWGISKKLITEQGWGDSLQIGALRLTAETALHHSNRCSMDRNTSSWNSYVFETKEERVFWSGDTGYARHFKELKSKYEHFDLAILEIDAWSPSCPNAHLFPDEVIKAALDLNAAAILPIHWAVYDLAFHPWTKSIDMVHDLAKEEDIPFYTPMMGACFKLNAAEQGEHISWWKFAEQLAESKSTKLSNKPLFGELGAVAELDLKSLPILAPLFL